ncbi:uncharacterized protein SPSK_04995 [Sporothrix schenckii 1099-18]|uniref:Uncharacterized protein n=1 Tax=Sporothrix schenckii 1099-18 TaxID=1397361 RepID=A0A0F2LV08_SPOSC|nr:uncharacterized protein SPSK_04995 [Sporothrix schenckii 1099-18]KJR80674.1 hypothetical protein SPSK_04995 [Sporothrix schenckii 1099-18]
MPSVHDEGAEWRAQGRYALSDYLYIRPYDVNNLEEFLDGLERRYDVVRALAGEQNDTVRIWHCLNMLEDADPHWENRLHAFRSKRMPKTKKKKKKLEKIEWELIQNWDDFVRLMIYRGGKMQFRPPADDEEVGLNATARTEHSGNNSAVNPTPVDKQPLDKQVVEKQLPLRLAAEAAKPLVAENNTAETADALGNYRNPMSKASAEAKGTTTKDKPDLIEASKLDSQQTVGDTAKQGRSVGKEDTLRTSVTQPYETTATSYKLEGDDEDYDDCGDHDGPDSGYADDVNYEDVDVDEPGDRNEEDIVLINGEIRYQIPGYALRKKPRHTLISAPRFVIKSFFRSKFPGCPRCPECRCQHPTKHYMLCSFCDFCHVGGDAECYHQHPELRGTRPAKDKYRQASSPVSDTEPQNEPFSESDVDTVKGVNDSYKQIRSADSMEDLACSLDAYVIIEKDTVHQDSANKQFVFTDGAATSTSGKPSATAKVNYTVDLPVRTKTNEGHNIALGIAKPPATKQAGQAVQSQDATNDISQRTKRLETASTSVPESAFLPTPVSAMTAPVAVEQAPAPALPAPKTAAPTTSNGDEGGARLNPENLSRVPHDQTHRRWASMSSLTTSSSGTSLVAFRRHRTDQAKKKAAVSKAAAKEAAAAKAIVANLVTKTAAVNKAVAENRIATDTLLFDSDAWRTNGGLPVQDNTARLALLVPEQRKQEAEFAARIAERQLRNAQHKATDEAQRLAREEQRIINKKTKAAQKRERQREQRRERQEEKQREQKMIGNGTTGAGTGTERS